MKVCKICGIEKPLDEFYYRTPNKNGSVSLRMECKSCRIEIQRYKKLGVCNVKYEEMLAKQKGVCAVCGCKLESSRYTKLCVDHNHTTGKIRGLLCTACNTAIGLMKDSTHRLANAIAYLQLNDSQDIVCSV